MLRKTAWIWLIGSLAWTIDAFLNLRVHNTPQAVIAAVLALLFLAAWLFYRNQTR